MFAEQEQRIIDRLRERLGPEVTVEPLRELERVPELRQKAPAAWVIYDGMRPVQVSGDPRAMVQQVALDWYVVIAAKSARGNGGGNDARDQAGAMATQAIEALIGYDMGGGKFLRLSEAPGPEYDAGYCHLPLAFSCATTLKGRP